MLLLNKFQIEFLVLVDNPSITEKDIAHLLAKKDKIWTNKSVRKLAKQNEMAGLVIDDEKDSDLIRIAPFISDFYSETPSDYGSRSSKAELSKAGQSIDVEEGSTQYSDYERAKQAVIQKKGRTEKAFLITAMNSDLGKAEYLRFFITSELRKAYRTSNLYITYDGVSEEHAATIYPALFRVETLIRRFLTHFFIPFAGSDWLEQTASKSMHGIIKHRRSISLKSREWRWSELLDDHLHFMDFSELGKLITSQSFGLNEPEQIVERLDDVNDWEDFLKLKEQMQSNYSRFFQDTFQNHKFHQHWGKLLSIRHRVAHSSLLREQDVRDTEHLVKKIEIILKKARTQQKESGFLPPADQVLKDEGSLVQEAGSEVPQENDYQDLMPKLKILGKADFTEDLRREKMRRKVDQSGKGESGMKDDSDTNVAQETDSPTGQSADKEMFEFQLFHHTNMGLLENKLSTVSKNFRLERFLIHDKIEDDQEEPPPWIIEKEELLDALEEFTGKKDFKMSRYFALSTFANMLQEEGYDRASVKRLAYQMDKDEDSPVEIYSYNMPGRPPITSIRLRRR